MLGPGAPADPLPLPLSHVQRTAPVTAAVQQKLQTPAGSVVQLYRYPGLSESKAKTLLRKAHDKASDKITGLDGELVSGRGAQHQRGTACQTRWPADRCLCLRGRRAAAV